MGMKIAVFQGYNRHGVKVLHRGSDAYGPYQGLGVIGCGEWDVLIDRMDLVLEQAETLGLTNSMAYVAAKKYYDNHTGWNKQIILTGNSCTEETREANDRLRALNAAMTSAGVATVLEGSHEVVASEGTDYAALVKWVVGGAIAVSLAITAATVVPRLIGKRRSVAGYRRRRQRR